MGSHANKREFPQMRMVSKTLACLAVLATAATVHADWNWNKEIDISSALPTGARAKDVIADSNGNIYFTAFFGGGTNQIWKIADPLTATPTITTFNQDGSYGSSNAATLAIDNNDNIYFAYDTSDAADSYIKKYDTSGNLVTAFGTNGTLSPIVMGGTNVRPRDIGFSGAATNKLLIGTFGTVYEWGILDATTGADGGKAASLGDSNENGTIEPGEGEVYHGLCWDDTTATVYVNAQGDLVSVGGTSASLSNIATFTDTTLVVDRARLNTSSNGLDYDATDRLIAYTASIGAVNAIKVGVYDIAAGTEELVGAETGENGYINSGGSPAFMRSGGELYLVVVDYYTNALEVFESVTGVDDWALY